MQDSMQLTLVSRMTTSAALIDSRGDYNDDGEVDVADYAVWHKF
jgi:hypothetical protein